MVFHLLFVEGSDQQKNYRKKIWISSLRKLNGRICHQNCIQCCPLLWYYSIKEYFSASGLLDFILLSHFSLQAIPCYHLHSSPSTFPAQKPDLSLPWEVAFLLTALHTSVSTIVFWFSCILVHPWSAFALRHWDTPASIWLSPVPAGNLCRNFMCRSWVLFKNLLQRGQHVPSLSLRNRKRREVLAHKPLHLHLQTKMSSRWSFWFGLS